MIKVPCLKAQYQIRQQKGEGVFLLSEFGHTILTGKANELIIPLIDGKNSSEAIAQSLVRELTLEASYFNILKLEKDGFIMESDPSQSESSAPYWNFYSKSPSEAKKNLKSFSVQVDSFIQNDSSKIVTLLESNSFKVLSDAAIAIAITDDYLNPAFKDHAEKMYKAGKSCLPIKAMGGVVWIGPMLGGDTGICVSCISSRIKANRNIESYLNDQGEEGPLIVSKIDNKPIADIGYNIAILQLNNYIVNRNNSLLHNHLITFDLMNLSLAYHNVVRRPQCKDCGDIAKFQKESTGPISMQEVSKFFTQDGGHRNTSPLATYEKYKHHVSPITGVVEYLKPGFHSNQVDHLSYVAGHNFALKSFKSVRLLKQNMRMVSGGKGSTEVQARTSALCEALERYSGVYQGEELIIPNKTINEMGADAIHPNQSMLYSDLQYKERMVWMQKGSHFNTVPVEFNPKEQTDWSPVWSLSSNKNKYLPSSYLYYNYPIEPEKSYSFADSNGCAAGNTKEEAILQGFFELIERDAVAIWWYNRLYRQAVDLDSFNSPKIAEIKAKYSAIGREIWVLDLTFDFPVPTFVALTRNINSVNEEIVFGFGAHFDASVAIHRALTEMNQFIPWVEKIRNNQIFFDMETSNWFLNATVTNQPYLVPLNIPAKKAWEFPNYSHPKSITQDVLLCKSLVEDKGMEMLVHDQTRPDIGLNVVKVIVPGLRHFWARYAPGRLFDVPVQMGILPKSLNEREFNPISMFV